ncbi:hypothetical protein Amsp01_042760 [Amycolatopsis sp. NBRC 101858]|nr:hypothetical protein Amsp01_042760 [Amycolatopsis sp. NBRC 101858]
MSGFQKPPITINRATGVERCEPGIGKGLLSNVERGRDAPNWDLVTFYEEADSGDGQLWSTYIEVVAAPR